MTQRKTLVRLRYRGTVHAAPEVELVEETDDYFHVIASVRGVPIPGKYLKSKWEIVSREEVAHDA